MTEDAARDEAAGVGARVKAAASAAASATPDIRSHATETVERAKDGGAAAASVAGNWADDLRAQVGDADALRAAGRRGSERLAAQVRAQPFETLMLAAAVGYLAAWIIHRD